MLHLKNSNEPNPTIICTYRIEISHHREGGASTNKRTHICRPLFQYLTVNRYWSGSEYITVTKPWWTITFDYVVREKVMFSQLSAILSTGPYPTIHWDSQEGLPPLLVGSRASHTGLGWVGAPSALLFLPPSLLDKRNKDGETWSVCLRMLIGSCLVIVCRECNIQYTTFTRMLNGYMVPH